MSAFDKKRLLWVQEDRRKKEGSKAEDRQAGAVLPSSFVVCCLFKALVYYCFLVFHCTGAYISLDLF